MTAWALRFPEEQIVSFADAYAYENDTQVVQAGIRSRERGVIAYQDFLDICQ